MWKFLGAALGLTQPQKRVRPMNMGKLVQPAHLPTFREVGDWTIYFQRELRASAMMLSRPEVQILIEFDEPNNDFRMEIASPGWHQLDDREDSDPFIKLTLPPALPRRRKAFVISTDYTGLHLEELDEDFLYDMERSAVMGIEFDGARKLEVPLADIGAALAARAECDTVHQPGLPPSSIPPPDPSYDGPAEYDELRTIDGWQIGVTTTDEEYFLARRDTGGTLLQARVALGFFHSVQFANPAWDWINDYASYHLAFRLEPSGKTEVLMGHSPPLLRFSDEPGFCVFNDTDRGFIDELARNRSVTIERRGQKVATVDLDGLRAALAEMDRYWLAGKEKSRKGKDGE